MTILLRAIAKILLKNSAKKFDMPDRETLAQRPDGYTSFMEGMYEGLMDDKGNVVISPALGYREIECFIDGVAIGFRLDHKPNEGGWGLLNEKGEKITAFKYWYIELFVGRNLYCVSVTPGLRKNLMWNDGTLVFDTNFQSIYPHRYRNGYVVVGNTIRKTKTTPTRYPKGLMHVNGEMLLPVVYDDIDWEEGYDDILCTKRDGYIGYVRALYGEHTGIEMDVTLPGIWKGIKGTACEKCIYRRGIDKVGRGCGRLFTKSFRDRNLRGDCEYSKTRLDEPSIFEQRAMERWQIIVRLQDPLKEHRQLVNDFIEEHLDGDINRLADYDLRQLKGMDRYGDTHGYAFDIYRTDLVRAIAAVAFQDIVPKEVMFDKKRGMLTLAPAPLIKEDLWGNEIYGEFVMLTIFHHEDKASVNRRILPCAKLCNTIGNLYIHPRSFDEYRHSHAHGRFLIDHTFADLHKALTGGKASLQMKKAVSGAKEFFDPYRGDDGWQRLMGQWLTEDLVDYYYNPEPFFEEITFTTYMPASVYFRAVDRCIETCHEIIPPRAKKMVERLKNLL